MSHKSENENAPPERAPTATQPLSTSLLAGGMAGLVVDAALFPLDTLKTRLQSAGGLAASGGTRSLYAGISSILIGSAPGAALFFVTYESIKQALSLTLPFEQVGPHLDPPIHIVSATLAEISACTVRVPVEVLKQRMQALHYRNGLFASAQSVYAQEGLLGFYRGFQATLQREIPFACLQYPLYEWLRRRYAVNRATGKLEESWKAALCGSVAGGVTALLTTPFDVIKTRTMLSTTSTSSRNYTNPFRAWTALFKEGGLKTLFAGALPRALWISFGGFIFFGAYERTKAFIMEK